MFDIITAMDINGGIGKKGSMPWKIPLELAYFHQVTTTTADPTKKNIVIMGRNTWESIPPAHRPLENRINYVLSRNVKSIKNSYVFHSFSDALTNAEAEIQHEKIYVIGGKQIYTQAIHQDQLQSMYITRIYHDFDCDKFFPTFNKEEYHIEKIKSIHALDLVSNTLLQLDFLIYTKKNIIIKIRKGKKTGTI